MAVRSLIEAAEAEEKEEKKRGRKRRRVEFEEEEDEEDEEEEPRSRALSPSGAHRLGLVAAARALMMRALDLLEEALE